MSNPRPLGATSELPLRVLSYVRRHALAPPGEAIVVGVSGGPDSVCLAHLLARAAGGLGVRLHLAHLNHRLRGTESDADEAFVSSLATRFGLLLSSSAVDVRGYQAAHRLSLEEAAREVRYRFFARVAASAGASTVAVGHTSDDLVETVLLNLIRGSGARGLVGLRPRSGWRVEDGELIVVRPLLEVSREETEEYCRVNGLNPRLDSSNLSSDYLRNRVRLELVPALETFNPRIRESLRRTSYLLADDIDLLEGEARRAFSRLTAEKQGNLLIDAAGFRSLGVSIQRHLLREVMKVLLGGLKDVEWRHIEDARLVLGGPAGRSLSLPGGLILNTGYDRHVIGPDLSAASPYPPLEGVCRLAVPGVTALPGWTVRCEVFEDGAQAGAPAGDDDFLALVDLDRSGADLLVRARQAGDRFQPLGMTVEKKLQDFMVNARIPRLWRDRVPLVVSGSQIVWVAGYRIDDRVRVTAETRRVLRITFARCPSLSLSPARGEKEGS